MQINDEEGWTRDCGGKQDYDPDIISISARYYPNHTVSASLVLWDKDTSIGITLAEQKFKGETEADVKRQAEEWSKARFDEIVELLKTKYRAIQAQAST